MKWITHQTGAVAAAMALHMPLAALAGAFAGAVLPDMLDQAVSRLGWSKKARQKIFNKVHRGNSHWFGWWLALFLASAAAPLPPAIKALCVGLALGATSHVALDMLTTRGVPLLPFSQGGRISLGLCSTGKWSEYVFLAAIVAVSLLFMGEDMTGLLTRLSGGIGEGSWTDLARGI